MVNIRPISDELAQKARAELNEDPVRMQDDIDALKAWLSKQPHLRARTDDQFLISFLRGTKFSLERAKQKLEMFYTIRSTFTEQMTERDTSNSRVLEIIRLGISLPLPITDESDSPRIMIFRPGAFDCNKYTIQEIMKVSIMINDILLIEDDNLTIAGEKIIIDLSNTTMQHLLQYNRNFLMKLTMLGQEASPIRQKGFHYIHAPIYFDKIFNVYKKFINEKNQSRIHVHGENMDLFHQYIPKRFLPIEYGGEKGTIQDIIDEWENKLISYQWYFDEEKNYGVDETKRNGQSKSVESYFGVDGSFRKLHID